MNNDLISRSALIAEFERIYTEHYKCTCYQFIHDIFRAMFRRLKNAPAVDAVEVVRCKDCKHYAVGASYVCEFHSEFPDQYSRGLDMQMLPDDFCSYGERKDGADG